MGVCINVWTSAENSKAPSVKVAASIFQEIIYNNKDTLHASVIVAGYDEKTGGEVYQIPLGGSLHKQEYSISGSGSSYIYGYCNEHFKSNMTKQEAIEFVKTALSEAIKWDGSSGGVIRVADLTKEPTQRYVYYPEEYSKA